MAAPVAMVMWHFEKHGYEPLRAQALGPRNVPHESCNVMKEGSGILDVMSRNVP